MSAASIAVRRLPLLSNSAALPRARLLASQLTRQHPTLAQTSFRMDKDQSRGESTTGISEWKQRPPYRVHENMKDFDVKYEANCHCGKVKYQLSRREPLDSKLCHCTTCQTQHGKLPPDAILPILIHPSRTLPMGCHLPQRRHQLHQRSPRPRVVRPNREVHRAQASLQSPLLLLPFAHHGRGPQHDPALPFARALEDR